MQNRFAGETSTVRNIPINLVRALPQVRTQFKASSISELAADIKAHGLLQPIVVRPDGQGYTVIIGERRLRALQEGGAEYVPALVASINEDQREEIQLIENIQREDLSAKDLTGSVHKLWKKHGSVAKVAKICNKSKSWVSKRLAVAMDVGPLTLELLDANIKDVELLYAFATLEKADAMRARALLPEILDKTATRKDVQAALQAVLGKKGDDAPKPEDTTGDLFEDQDETPAIETSSDFPERMKLEAALKALRAIDEMPKALSPLVKWERARDAVKAALEAIEGQQ
jgi:ParB family chromosome partitioning protein